MKTAIRTIATGVVAATAGIAFARLLGPKACAACKSHCGQRCACRPSEPEPEREATDEAQQTV